MNTAAPAKSRMLDAITPVLLTFNEDVNIGADPCKARLGKGHCCGR